ncbi:phosphotransferase [Gordonia sp. NB41Y]|uniref:phosphotransferase family protein n=1 Tax=Gordonia sp. NB41Y TaxID=875808 RepID=UPI0002C01F34|nr:phosphotransferase [Gordonia sp. NB41Y]EMP13371.1 phosphotransferase [Gordonia sp. NB41Y]WLP92390.1 phosphotransferase [Gordonia sp. NB41Y]
MTETGLGELLATGRTSDIHVWGDDKVIKVFKDDVDTAMIAKEIRDSATVHQLGVTPIRYHGAVTMPDGRMGIVVDRLHGDALTTVAERRPYKIASVARRLAREHTAIHATATTDFDDVRDVAQNLLHTCPLSGLTLGERDALRRQIQALPEGNSVLHLDFHPLNTFEHGTGIATIDWQSTASGHPAADVAATCLLFTEAELFPGISAFQRALYQSVRRVMLRSYLAEYTRITGIGRAEIAPWMTTARILRLGWLDVESEREPLLTRIRASIATTS